MSNHKDFSDYDKPRTDLNKLLPAENIKDAKILEGLNHNLFNRFLTKDEVERVFGIIGSTENSTDSTLRQIAEPTAYRQANQLRPLLYNKVGDVDWLMSFRDFMNRLRLLGVDIDKFNEWGNSLQFNWIPPIDLDKLINFQDYFWDSSNTDNPPQYITIKNLCNWVTDRRTQIMRSIGSSMPTYSISAYDEPSNIVRVSGNQTTTIRDGEAVVLSGTGTVPVFAPVVSTAYNVGGDYTEVAFNVADYDIEIGVNDSYVSLSKTELAVLTTNALDNTITVASDVTNLFVNGYVFSSEASTTSQPTTMWTVASSSFDVINNRTVITLNQELDGTFDWTRISATPILRSVEAEYNVACNNPYTVSQFGTFDESDIGDIIWARNFLLLQSTGSTTFGSSFLTDPSGSKDFLDGTYQDGDILKITGTGFDDEYTITNLITSNLLDLGRTFFNEPTVSYQILRRRSLEDISFTTAPPAINVSQLWLDTENDQLRQWNGSTWAVAVDRFSLIVDISNNNHLVSYRQSDDWSEQNNWIHRSEINNFTGKSRAQLPIIEYFPLLELSEHSFAEKAWRYRRNDAVSYTPTDTQPTLFELVDTRVVSGGEVSFSNSTTLLFGEQFGNLSNDLTPGTEIQLGDFGTNTGVNTVLSSEFLQLAPGQRYRTRVTLAEPIINPLDVPVGAFVAPTFTAEGDPWLSTDVYHWQFEGIVNIAASSYTPERNPMLDEVVTTSTISAGTIETIIGLYFQEFKYVTGSGSVFGPLLELDSSLHDLCLYEDFQESDLRVYINGERQYGNFVEMASGVASDFVGSVQFNPDVEISENDIVRIELGEYALEDIGRKNVTVSTSSGLKQFNLVDNRRIEQVKTERSQYPWFSIYDVDFSPFTFASRIFVYNEDSTGVYEPNIDQRIVFDPVARDYTFAQELMDEDTEALYVYRDLREYDDEFQSIWKRGTHNEQYVPIQADGFWEIPNQLYYNVQHENKSTIRLTEVFRHFNSIVQAQSAPGIVNDTFANLFHLDNSVNYGLGGTIKEHNDGFDTLMSAMFVNNVNPVELIQFANDRYDNGQVTLREILEDNIGSYFSQAGFDNLSELTAFVVDSTKDIFEKNDRLDQWFGDSATFDEATNTGVKNWIATIPFLGLAPKVKPYLVRDDVLGILEIVHHDGHRKDVKLSPASIELLYNIISKNTNNTTQVVASSGEAFPTLVNGTLAANGDFLIRTNTTEKTRKLYRYNTLATWELVELSLLVADILLQIENDLYDLLSDQALPENFVSKYNFLTTQEDSAYDGQLRERFSQFLAERNVQGAFVNAGYRQNNPFTWNYGFTTIQVDPLTGGNNTSVFSSWEALYESVFRTPYPHLEPWKLQGYDSKPDYWDTQYRDPTNVRRWKTVMWTNILDGIIPIGQVAPDTNLGTGTPSQITNLYSYVPVNIESTNTSDGYFPDSLLPPYWNSNNSSNPAVRSLHDSGNNEFVVTPSAGYEFGQIGPEEWNWKVSSQRLYDELIVAFKIQPLKFLNQTFGPELIDVACLQVDDRSNKVASHRNINFHGDIVNGNTVFKASGLNQWYVHYNRYRGFDGISSEFRDLWRDWEAPLTYQFGSFINTQNFKIGSDIFDVTDQDRDIIFKKTLGIRDVWLDGINATMLSSPSRFSSEFDKGIGWTVEFKNTSPVARPIETFGVQNYPVRVTSGDDTYRTFSFNIEAVELEQSFGYDIVQYSETAAPTVSTELANDTTPYYASVLFDGTTTVNLIVLGQDAQTFGDLVDVLNSQLGSAGTAFIEDGNLYIASDKIGGSTFASITDSGLFSTVSSNYQGTSGNQFNFIKFNKVFYVEDDLVQYFNRNTTFEIKDSTNFNGTYTVVVASYNTESQLTRIEVQENISISNSVIDGVIEPDTAVTLPDSWVTGTGLSWGTNTSLPAPFNETDLFYMIRVNDREFKLSTTRDGALNGNPITPTSVPDGIFYVGRIKNTFTAFQAREVLAYWKQHYVDNRIVRTLPTPVTISGIQNCIDFLNGYSAYLESIGFVYANPDGNNSDPTTGREYNWQLETEYLIEFLYTARRTGQEIREEYAIAPNNISNNFTSQETIAWNTGTRVTFNSSKGTLPTEFNNPIADTIGYYVIRTATPGILQLAASRSAAVKGNALTFTDNGEGALSIRISPETKRFPSIDLNPHKNMIFIDHDTGVLSNVLTGSDLDVLTNQRVYDQDGRNLGITDVAVYRKDERSQIELTGQRVASNDTNTTTARYMSGMHLFFDGYEHILQFQNYSVNGILIYDPFLGINTPRFDVEFDKQDKFTLRPNVGGNVILDRGQVQNIESAIESLRFAYSTTQSKEGEVIVENVRKSLGYDGPYDYADDLGITDKSQFLFYRGLIQKKGTNFAANAFTNQISYDNIEVDEFWTYRIDCFGDSKQKIYPELKLSGRDVIRKELRLEFVEPFGTASDTSFEAVEIDNESRWFEQPDQVEKISPRDRFYVNPRIIERIEDVRANDNYFDFNGDDYLLLEAAADAAFINFVSSIGPPVVYQQLVEGVDYEFVTNTLIRFINLPVNSGDTPTNVSTLAYNYDAQNPAKIINTRAGEVETEVPFWNPRRQQYYSRAIYPVNFRVDEDPAGYSNPIANAVSAANNVWDSRFNNNVWFDINSEGYLPFDDPNVQSDLNIRLRNWGKLADWATIKLYQWTESDVLPVEYDQLSSEQNSAGLLPINDRKTGQARKVVYRNDGTTLAPVWVEERNQHFDFVAEMIDSTVPTNLVISTSYSASGLSFDVDVDVYVDGKYVESTQFSTNADFDTYAGNVVTGTGLPQGKLIHIVLPATVPTQLQLDNVSYKLDTPYSTINRIDPVTGNEKFTYYFWVENRLSDIQVKGGPLGSTTLKTMREQFENIPTPYMIPNNVVDLTATSYADLFDTNSPKREDTVSYEFPFVYNQLIIKGLAERVRADDAYTLRFTRDFTLRDNLANNDPSVSELQLKNLHWQWKLFREKQFTKIDRILWNAITESILGFQYDGSPLLDITPTPTPSITPTVSPSPSGVVGTQTPTPTPSNTGTPFPTPTQQATPTVTPNPTTTPPVTPPNTPGPTSTPAPTPPVTPSRTPVVSPTPSPAEVLGLFFPSTGTVYSGDIIDQHNVFDPQPASTGMQFTRTGINPENSVIVRGVERYKWMKPIGFPSSPYEIRVSVSSGAFTSGSAINTWIDLGTFSPAWSITQNGIGARAVSGTVQIREKSGGAIVLSRDFSFSANVSGDSGGGKVRGRSIKRIQ